MCILRRGRALVVALAGLALAGAESALPAYARADQYAFELVNQKLKPGSGAVVTVRLLHKPSGRVVPGAVVFLARIDMSPHGMAGATAPIELLPDTLPGYFRFETDLLMKGEWALSLAAQVPGEIGTVQARLVLEAAP